MNEEIDRMIQMKIIEKAVSPKWLSPIIAVKKTNGKVRLCLDARELNKRTVKLSYPQQNANRILSRLRGSKYLSTIDLSDAYYQIKIEEGSRDCTSFSVSTKGTYRYIRMANGLCNAASTLCEVVDGVIGCDLEPLCFQYMDDFVIATDTFEEHIKIIESVLQRLNTAGFTISLEKSKFCREKIKFLGYIISEKGVECDKEKIQTIIDYPIPTTL